MWVVEAYTSLSNAMKNMAQYTGKFLDVLALVLNYSSYF